FSILKNLEDGVGFKTAHRQKSRFASVLDFVQSVAFDIPSGSGTGLETRACKGSGLAQIGGRGLLIQKLDPPFRRKNPRIKDRVRGSVQLEESNGYVIVGQAVFSSVGFELSILVSDDSAVLGSDPEIRVGVFDKTRQPVGLESFTISGVEDFEPNAVVAG